ncbi:hypothetical protein MKZ38_004383 [Zalerion maritima]|uniref:Uncharacterized protein n=1 Tax=Zalerion maritima TaxID=339359 RepID=A0AAD5RLN8_9PEZI|nr:hypothetical protein MKZ38_004383 [Zalerion maritima]
MFPVAILEVSPLRLSHGEVGIESSINFGDVFSVFKGRVEDTGDIEDAPVAPVEDTLDYFKDQAGVQFLGLAAYFIAEGDLESATKLLGGVFKQWQWSNGEPVAVPNLSDHIRQLLHYINDGLGPRVGPSGKGHIKTNQDGEGIDFELYTGKLKITGKGNLKDFKFEEHET